MRVTAQLPQPSAGGTGSGAAWHSVQPGGWACSSRMQMHHACTISSHTLTRSHTPGSSWLGTGVVLLVPLWYFWYRCGTLALPPALTLWYRWASLRSRSFWAAACRWPCSWASSRSARARPRSSRSSCHGQQAPAGLKQSGWACRGEGPSCWPFLWHKLQQSTAAQKHRSIYSAHLAQQVLEQTDAVSD